MEKEYVKELDRAYLVLGDGQIDEDEYVIQMAMRGRLPGILLQPAKGAERNRRAEGALKYEALACSRCANIQGLGAMPVRRRSRA